MGWAAIMVLGVTGEAEPRITGAMITSTNTSNRVVIIQNCLTKDITTTIFPEDIQIIKILPYAHSTFVDLVCMGCKASILSMLAKMSTRYYTA